jgi:hypothetical protein
MEYGIWKKEYGRRKKGKGILGLGEGVTLRITSS